VGDYYGIEYNGLMKKWKIISFVLMGVILLLLGLYLFIFRLDRVTYFGGSYEDYGAGELSHGTTYDNGSCSIAGINIHGEIMTYLTDNEYADDYVSSEDIYAQLEEAEASPYIKAIMLDIDSYGGMPVAAEELANKIASLNKPVVAFIRSGGASAAYWIASSADHILASELSDIGSIGVTMSYLDEAQLNAKEGYTWNSLSTGPYKDAGSSDKPLTAAERAIFERDIKLTFDKFVDVVAKNRGMSVEKIRALADGSTMMGKQALANGLIDEIGFLPEAQEYLKSVHKVEGEVCW